MKKDLSKNWFIKTACVLPVLIIILLVHSCKKESSVNLDNKVLINNEINLSGLKSLYKSDTTVSPFSVASFNSTNSKYFIRNRNIKWDNIYYQQRDSSRVMEFDMEKDSVLITLGIAPQKCLNKNSLIFIEFNTGKNIRCYMKVIQDLTNDTISVIQNVHYNSIPAGFNGEVMFYNLNRQIINGYKYVNGKITAEYFPSGTTGSTGGATVQAITGKKVSELIATTYCYEAYNYNYLASDPNTIYVVDSGYQECYTVLSDGGGGGGGFGGGGTVGGDSSGGGSPTSPTQPPPCPPVYADAIKVVGGKATVFSLTPGSGGGCPTAPTISNQDLQNAIPVIDNNPRVDPNKYINCFTDGKIASGYIMTIYIDQPVYGADDWWSLSSNSSDNIYTTTDGRHFNVGHTFVGFQKINTDGSSVTQVLGFYPGSTARSAPGIIEDNGDHHYTESYSVSVSQNQFNAAMTAVVHDAATANYTLVNGISSNPEYNCTDAAKSWFGAAGIGLPSASRWPFTNSPGDFGEAIMSVSGAVAGQGHAPLSHGPCN